MTRFCLENAFTNAFLCSNQFHCLVILSTKREKERGVGYWAVGADQVIVILAVISLIARNSGRSNNFYNYSD